MQIERNAFIGCDREYEAAKTVIFGAPFDSTTSYRPGTRFGSKAIRSESFGIETYSPYQDKDLLDYNIFDAHLFHLKNIVCKFTFLRVRTCVNKLKML